MGGRPKIYVCEVLFFQQSWKWKIWRLNSSSRTGSIVHGTMSILSGKGQEVGPNMWGPRGLLDNLQPQAWSPKILTLFWSHPKNHPEILGVPPKNPRCLQGLQRLQTTSLPPFLVSQVEIFQPTQTWDTPCYPHPKSRCGSVSKTAGLEMEMESFGPQQTAGRFLVFKAPGCLVPRQNLGPPGTKGWTFSGLHGKKPTKFKGAVRKT